MPSLLSDLSKRLSVLVGHAGNESTPNNYVIDKLNTSRRLLMLSNT